MGGRRSSPEAEGCIICVLIGLLRLPGNDACSIFPSLLLRARVGREESLDLFADCPFSRKCEPMSTDDVGNEFREVPSEEAAVALRDLDSTVLLSPGLRIDLEIIVSSAERGFCTPLRSRSPGASSRGPRPLSMSSKAAMLLEDAQVRAVRSPRCVVT